MKNLFIFLLIALASTYSIKPSDKSKIWINATLIPLISLIIYGLIIYLLKSAYSAGREIAMSFIPAIISGIVIYFQMKRKIENENIVKFPIVLVIFISISLIGSIVYYSLEKRNKEFVQEYSKNNDLLNFNSYSDQEAHTDNEQLLSQSQIKIPKSWTLYEIENIGNIAIPPSLELRDDNSYSSLAAETIHDDLISRERISLNKPQLVFQPRGINKMQKDAFDKYARITINYYEGKDGDFFKWNEKFDMTISERRELNEYFKNEVVIPLSKLNTKVLDWYPIEIGNINGLSYIKTSFIRQMDSNPIIKVESYKFFNFNEAIELTISFRTSEKELWESDLSKVYNYFDFTHKN